MSTAGSYPAFAETAHRPWPLPARPWTWQQAWVDLLFLHFEADPAGLRRHLPPGLELDLHDGKAWIGIVPFRMEGVTKRGWPAPAWLCDFAEINVRTYVRHGGKAGVWFFSLDVVNPLVAGFARTFFHLPYFSARIAVEAGANGTDYLTERGSRRFDATYRGGAAAPSVPGSFAHWATERYCLYTADRAGRLLRGEVHHVKWPLERAELTLRANTLSPIELGARHPEVFYSPRVDVAIWPLEPVT